MGYWSDYAAGSWTASGGGTSSGSFYTEDGLHYVYYTATGTADTTNATISVSTTAALYKKADQSLVEYLDSDYLINGPSTTTSAVTESGTTRYYTETKTYSYRASMIYDGVTHGENLSSKDIIFTRTWTSTYTSTTAPTPQGKINIIDNYNNTFSISVNITKGTGYEDFKYYFKDAAGNRISDDFSLTDATNTVINIPSGLIDSDSTEIIKIYASVKLVNNDSGYDNSSYKNIKTEVELYYKNNQVSTMHVKTAGGWKQGRVYVNVSETDEQGNVTYRWAAAKGVYVNSANEWKKSK